MVRRVVLHKYWSFNWLFAFPLQISVFLTHWVDKRSPFLRLTNLLLSHPNKLNLDSSLKRTIFHSSSDHTISSEVNSRRHRIRPTIFFVFNLRKTVFVEIGFPVCSQNAREIDAVVSKRSFKDILTIIRASRWLVLGGLPVLSLVQMSCYP